MTLIKEKEGWRRGLHPTVQGCHASVKTWHVKAPISSVNPDPILDEEHAIVGSGLGQRRRRWPNPEPTPPVRWTEFSTRLSLFSGLGSPRGARVTMTYAASTKRLTLFGDTSCRRPGKDERFYLYVFCRGDPGWPAGVGASAGMRLKCDAC